ncbi:MAG TPA: glycoside hydrolase family 88 protein [Flavisolibacter sp.]|nr:glycoside hydrolase family 88 protein [Flavisolibacter sp.]
MKKLGVIAVLMILFVTSKAQSKSYAAEMAKTVMTVWKDSMSNGKPARWSYDQSVILKGIEGLWRATGEKKYFDYIQKSMDLFVEDNGNIRTYDQKDFNIDNVSSGRNVLLLYNVTGKEKYLKAVQTIRQQLREHPRTNEGGFWHKKIYPYQMWLDGLYMGEPFYAEYAKTFHEDTAFNDIARQFILMEKNSVDKKTGLMYHGYDESRQQKWADKTTGRSSNFWARAMGWYGMGLVDVLEVFPANHPKRKELVDILNRYAKAVSKYQDAKTGLWWDIMDMPNKDKNYFEASASSMFVYALAKGVRLGCLPQSYLAVAKKGYDGILKTFIKEENGQTNLHGTVSVSGLGGNPYRDGSFDYYMSEKVIVNDAKGVGAFIQAANEMEMMPTLSYGKGKTVVLDYFFNNEWRKDATGTNIRYHYVWDDRMNSGFATLGDIFKSYGVQTKFLETAPTAEDLKGANIYIIVDPDTEKETTSPNYMNETYAKAIADWVKAGGVLILMANDKGNADLEHTNILASKFGVKFNEDNYNLVVADKFEQGAVMAPANNSVFKTAKKVYLKEVSTLQVSSPATAVLTKEGKNIVATAKYGKGSVFIVGDPWIYDEYADGRKLPAEFENFKAAQDIAKWAISQSGKR